MRELPAERPSHTAWRIEHPSLQGHGFTTDSELAKKWCSAGAEVCPLHSAADPEVAPRLAQRASLDAQASAGNAAVLRGGFAQMAVESDLGSGEPQALVFFPGPTRPCTVSVALAPGEGADLAGLLSPRKPGS